MKIQFDNGIKVEVDDNATDADIEEIYNQVTSSAQKQSQPAQQETSLLDRLQQRNYERVSRVMNQPANATPIIDPLISAARVPFGALADIPTEIASTAYKSLPEGVKSTIEGAIPDVVKQGISWLGEKAGEFSEKHPTASNVAGLALDLPSGTGTALLGKAGLKTGAKGVAKVGKGIENIGDETVNIAKKGEALNDAIKGRARRRFLDELVTDADALSDPKRKVLIDKYKTKVAIPNKDEANAAKTLYNIKEIKPNMLNEEARQIVESNITKKSKLLESKLASEVYTPKSSASPTMKGALYTNITKNIGNISKSASLSGDAKKSAQELFDAFKEIIDNEQDNLLGVWNARKKLDKVVEEAKGSDVFNMDRVNGFKAAQKEIRNTINDFIEKSTKDKFYKKSLNELSGLYTARDNIAEKAAKLEKATWGERKFEGVKKAITLRNMVTTAGILGGVGTGAIGAGVLPTALIAGAGYAGYKGYKAGKNIAPKVQKAVGKSLQKTGKGIQSSVNKLLP